MSASIYRSAESIIRKVGPCGSGSGVPVKDMDITGITRVVKIGIRHGNSIDALTISYERNGKVETTERWGGERGRLTEINLQPSEYITRVSGHIASWENTWQVRSLMLETNSNNYGPYGTQEGVPFDLPAFGGSIIGFFARAGSMLEAIGVYVKDKMDIVRPSTEPIIYKAGPCGSGSGVSTKDMNITGVTRIVKIDISHGNSIDSLTISYERNGKVESTERWGGQGAHLTEIKFEPIEYITRVSGHIASWGNTLQVRSIQLETNLNNTYGPYGTQEGVPFELPAVGGKIIGFFARAGSMLEAIGVYWKSSAKSIIRKVGPCGSGSGVPVKDMDITGITRVVKIGIRHGNSIDALTISYERNGKVETTERWGGERGRLTEIILQPSEYITRVSGHIASWENTWQVRSLMLETNSNNYGPYGTQEGVPFDLPAFGGSIIGFFARAGSMLEAIGVYVKDKMDIVWPSAEPIIYKAGPCGSGSGVSAKDMTMTGVTRIVKIDISHGNSIDSLTISYERNGKVESTERWGGQGGHLTEIKFQPNEYITHVSGHIASWGNTLQVRSLKLETNLNAYGPYGTQEGVPFELPAVGGKIIGFFARAGSMLEAIGVYIKAGSTTGKAGTWTTSETSFWGRPVSGA